MIVSRVPPVYPPLAKEARVQGVVSLNVVIGTAGNVESASVIQGPPLLAQAALDAVSQWTYRPLTLNGQPTKAVTQVDVNFTLAQ